MELYIETLTGTAFELRVSPFETIMSVKGKIQRLEGIPISQQHLIWQSMELEDDYCLHDYSIHDGATLKLVLAMRGGPINTRRVAMEDPTLREMAEYMEANRDEIWEKLPGNRQVTLLVFREGDQLNFFRVVDRGDGTLTPLSESLSGASMYNLYDEEEEETETPKEETAENEQTKEKMKLLRMKMESLTINKKPKKKPRPPSSGRPGSKARLRRISSASKQKGPTLNPKTCLPPLGQTLNNAKTSSVPSTTVVAESCYIKESTSSAGTASKSNSSSCSSSSTSPVKLPSSPRKQSDSIESAKLRRSLSSVREDLSNSRPTTSAKKDVDDKRKSSESSSQSGSLGSGGSLGKRPLSSKKKDLSSKGTPVNVSESIPKAPSSPRKKEITLESLKESLRPPTSSKTLERKRDLTLESLKDTLGRPPTSSQRENALESIKDNVNRPTTSSLKVNKDRKKELTLESLSSSEARAMSGLLRQASIERLGSSKIGSFVQSASKSRVGSYSRNGTAVRDGRIPTPEGRLVSARIQRLSASRSGRIMSPTHRLPPVKAKKKSGKRCFVCAKKTGLATSYQCRCGNNFCATHRYAESHSCTFDYKTEGRKLLEQSNPVVTAPKLPKI